MRTRGRVLSAAAALATAGSLMVGVAPAAMAVQAKASCPAETLCLYQYKNFGGKVWKYARNAKKKSLGSVNNSASSIVNATGHNFRLYSKKNYKGTTYTSKHDSKDGSFSNNKIGDNNIESLRVL